MKKTKKDKKYSVTLMMANWSATSEGDTASEALAALQAPIEVVADGVLSITDGTRTAKLDLTPHRMRRLFYPNSQFYVAEELELLMK